MAEAAAAFYTIETAVEGAAVGALAVAQSTTPLHLRFRELGNPSSSPFQIPATGHSLNVVRGKAYIFGGDLDGVVNDTSMKIVTLPSDIENGDLDYQLVHPQFETTRPLQQYSDPPQPHVSVEGFEDVSLSKGLADTTQSALQPRTFHAATCIDTNVYILAGRSPSPSTAPAQTVKSNENQLFNCDRIYCFSTQANKWSILAANLEKCSTGLPAPRTGASCSSTPHPEPDSAIEVTVHEHGTIFLHGGYDSHGQQLRDTWAFDVSSRVWTRWPDLPEPSAEEVAGEGRITCVNNRLWRAGDGFGKMMYVDFDVLRGNVVGATSGPHSSETSVVPKENMWHALSVGEKAASNALQSEIGAGSKKSLVDKPEELPVPRQGAGLVPVYTGAGRSFLLYFMGQDGTGSVLGDVWSFQIKAQGKTPAALKDAVRSMIGKETGENHWAPCDIVESTKEEGQLHPPRGLSGFATDVWQDLGGGNVVLWGGVNASGQSQPDCWVMSVE